MDFKIEPSLNSTCSKAQEIKIEPPDEIKVEEEDINQIFKCEPNKVHFDPNYYGVQSSNIIIVREDAGLDEIVKEEPKLNDECGSSNQLENSVDCSKQVHIQLQQEELPKRKSKIAAIMKLDEEAYCICRSSDCSRFMIACDACGEWYHGDCINISEKEAKRIKHYYCVDCNPAQIQAQTRNYGSKKITKSKTRTTRRKRISEPKLKANVTFECFLCRKVASSVHNLKRHYIRFHGEKIFRCNECSRTYSVKFSLDLHKRSHTGAKPFKCKICFRHFPSRANLRRHNGSCTARLSCNICRKFTFTLQSELAQHMLVHTEQKKFECDICSNKFRTKRNIKRHMRMHNRQGMFPCSHCNKEYTTKFARDAHQRRHNEV